MSAPKRARAARREKQRKFEKAVAALDKLAISGPGGTPERAIAVTSSTLVELRARAIPCPLCGGTMDMGDHAAVFHAAVQLRRVAVMCRGCHKGRDLYFSIGQILPS